MRKLIGIKYWVNQCTVGSDDSHNSEVGLCPTIFQEENSKHGHTAMVKGQTNKKRKALPEVPGVEGKELNGLNSDKGPTPYIIVMPKPTQVTQEYHRQEHKQATIEDADKLLRDVNYFGVMLVKLGLADGMVSGAIHSTADTVRPALQIIKTKPGISCTSGVFLMNREDTNHRLMFADCAINIEPNSQELAEIAINTAETAKVFGIDPKVAMLSFSTKGSAKSPKVDRVVQATNIAKEMRPDLAIDGELQFDAAFVPATAAIKAPDSDVAGHANVFVFPGLQAGNIGYKIAQRLGMFEAIGPILQGLNKPVNDLSRGASAEDIYNLAIITAAQALNN